MIMENASESKTIYQTEDTGFGVPESAIVVNSYKDNISIDGENGYVLLNRATIPELIRVLREYQKNIPE